jgi:hypothetical protein
MPITDFSYSGNPSASDLDALRFAIMDVDSADPQLSDAELNYLLTQKGSVQAAAIAACQRLITKYSRFVDSRFGPSSEANSQRVTMYKTTLAELRREAGTSCVPFAGGISKSSKDAYNADNDRVAPFFGRDKFSNPGLDQPISLEIDE